MEIRTLHQRDPDDTDLKRKAYTAVSAKMARVAHSLIKHNADYRGYHEVAGPGDGTSLFGPLGPSGYCR